MIAMQMDATALTTAMMQAPIAAKMFWMQESTAPMLTVLLLDVLNCLRS